MSVVVSDDESLNMPTATLIEIIDDDDDDEFTDESVNESDAEYEDEEITMKSGADTEKKQADDDDSSSSSSSDDSSGPKVDIMPTIPENPDSPSASSSSSNTRGSKSVVKIFGMDRISPDEKDSNDVHRLLFEGDNEVWGHSNNVDVSEYGDVEFEMEEVEEEENDGLEVEEEKTRSDDQPEFDGHFPFYLPPHQEMQSTEVFTDVEDQDNAIFVDSVDESLLESNDNVDLMKEQSIYTKLSHSDGLEFDPEQPSSSRGEKKKRRSLAAQPNESTLAYKHRVFILLTIFLITMLGMALLLWLKKDDMTPIGPEPSFAPTAAPTIDSILTPPTNPFRYEPVPDSVIRGQISSILGQNVAYDESLLIAGVPSSSAVFWSYSETSDTGLLEETDSSTGLGWSVDLADSRYLATGAPFLSAKGTNTSVGGVFVYRYEPGGEWEPVEPVVRGDEDLFAANENFGSAVAISHVGNGKLRVIVGAPYNSHDWSTSTGRVYTFEREIHPESGELLWNAMEQTPIIGDRDDVRFGKSVDISRDGSVFLTGAPGSEFATIPGYAVAHEYTPQFDDPWSLVFAVRGDQPNEEFGASVAILSDNGNVFAVGAPGFDQSSGRVLVYQKGGTGLYQQLGADILGESGDRIGELNTVTGGINENAQPFVLVATASGVVRRYDFSPSSNEWEDLYDSLSTGLQRISSLASTGDGGQLAVGSVDSNAIAIFRSFRS
ncbi:hypothetical protein FisN_7Lh101 [Fistulifera solaris]|uniref:Uncharacterized protein n=1 Tax=Fistulifera solaris TaxID=1519565 RepID=A0A1Z5JCK4_FISSO|nr:hypothetical protein FisN_7Lh101 [Fistulifera solaris]|eukprot:GAX11727.1 hypothetical protein FisN_7Lh101 [Fistulifera solaris]